MNKAQARRRIESIVGALRTLTRHDRLYLRSLPQGKLYELYVLADVLCHLRGRGFNIRFAGSNIHFKQAPGRLYMNDPHFVVQSPHGPQALLFVDVEFETLGQGISGATQKDLSSRHELDLVLVSNATDGTYPTYGQVLLAVECKSNAVLKKSSVREALGLRRELSYLAPITTSRLSRLSSSRSRTVAVPAYPASEYWVAFTDPRGMRYQQSFTAFGIDLRHVQP